jgi:hypothetical protein
MVRNNHKNAIKGEMQRQHIYGVLSVEPATATRVGQVLAMSYVLAYAHLTKMRVMVPKEAHVWGWKKQRGQWRAVYAAGNYADVPHPDELAALAQLVEVPVFIRREKRGRPAQAAIEAAEHAEQAENSAKAVQLVEAATAKQNSWLGALGM